MILSISKAADKALANMPKQDAAALVRTFRMFAAEPFATHSWAKALVGGGVRVRHGDWRAICDVDGKALVVLVIKIGNRREVYR